MFAIEGVNKRAKTRGSRCFYCRPYQRGKEEEQGRAMEGSSEEYYIPDELWLLVFENLPVNVVGGTCSLVCSKWFVILDARMNANCLTS